MTNHAWVNTFKILKDTHDDAFRTVDRAIKLEELEKPEHALQEYRKAVTLIDRALAVVVEPPDVLDDTWTEGLQLVQKMKGARQEILARVSAVNKNLEKSSETSAPIEVNAVQTRPRTYAELAEALRQLKHTQMSSANVLDLLFSCDDVKFYRIKATGEVTTESESSTLRVVRMEKDDERRLDSTIFLQVIRTSQATRIEDAEEPLLEVAGPSMEEQEDTSWIYPIISGVSPCYRTDYGALIFPDLEHSDGSAIGLVIGAPEADEIVLEILTTALHGVMKKGGVIEFDDLRQPQRRVSGTVSESLVKGAFYISKGMVFSAEKTGQLLNYTTPYIISRLQRAPAEQPISENVRTSVEVAKTVSCAAASFTGFVAGKVGTATMGLGRFLAPHIQKHGSTLLASSFGMDHKEANDTVNDILTICAGAVEGFGTVYEGLEKSAGILGANLSDNTVKIVEHKYGEEMSHVTKDGFDTVGNVINMSRNVNYFTPKGLAKVATKNAGKALVGEYLATTSGAQDTALYPDLKELGDKLKPKD